MDKIDWESYLVIFVSTINLVLSLIILFKSRERKKGATYFIAMFVASMYFLSNMLIDGIFDKQLQDILLRLAFIFPLFIIVLFSTFILTFSSTRQNILSLTNVINIIFALILTPIILFSDTIIYGVDATSLPVGSIKGELFVIYLICIISSFANLIYTTFRINKIAIGTQKLQFRFIIFGLLISIILTICTNLIFPLLGITQLVRIPSIFSLIFSGFVTYSVLKLQLFSLRTVFVELIRNLLIGLFFFTMVIAARIIKDNIIFKGYYSPEGLFLDLGLSILIANILSPLTKRLNLILYRFIKPEIFYLKKTIDQIKEQETKSFSLKEFYNKVITILENSFPHTKISILSETEFRKYKIPLLSNLNESYNIQTLEEDDPIYKSINQFNLFYVQPLSVTDYIVFSQKTYKDAYTISEIEVIQDCIAKISDIINRIQSINQISNFNQLLQQKVDFQTKALQKAYDRLKVEDESKNDILNIVSHQLLTPISIIRGEIEELTESINDKKKSSHIIQTLAFQSKRSYEIVDEILRVSRIIQSGGSMSVNKSQVDIIKLTRDIVAIFVKEAEAKGLKLNFIEPPKLKTININLDNEKINEVISNLLDNAISYTNTGHIDVTIEDNKKWIEILFKDTGIGIPKDKLPDLFNKFTRLENAKQVRPDGTGIGLYFVRLVVEAHGGEISATSNGEGKGSEFTVKLLK